jgi:hypothetical protein
MTLFLNIRRVRFKDFRRFTLDTTGRLQQVAYDAVPRQGRPVRYLEARFRRIATTVRPSLVSFRRMKELLGVSTSLLRRIRELWVWSFGVAEWVVVSGSTSIAKG